MKKLLALTLAALLVFALFAGCGSKSEPAAAEAPAEAPAAAGDDFAEWKAYLKEYATAGAPNEELGQSLLADIDAAATAEEAENILGLGVMFSSVGVLRFDEWVAAGKPAADTSDMGTPPVSGEPTGEAPAD